MVPERARVKKKDIANMSLSYCMQIFVKEEIIRHRGSNIICPTLSTMPEANKISAHMVTRAPDGPEFALEDLWRDSRCVIVFLRRFG